MHLTTDYPSWSIKVSIAAPKFATSMYYEPLGWYYNLRAQDADYQTWVGDYHLLCCRTFGCMHPAKVEKPRLEKCRWPYGWDSMIADFQPPGGCRVGRAFPWKRFDRGKRHAFCSVSTHTSWCRRYLFTVFGSKGTHMYQCECTVGGGGGGGGGNGVTCANCKTPA